jgi:hypothetical protein
MVATVPRGKLTTELRTKLLPFIASCKAPLFTSTELGEMLVMTGTRLGVLTTSGPALVAVPPAVVTVIKPDVAPAGTVKMSVVAFDTTKLGTVTPLRVTVVAPVRLVPVTVTAVPANPLAGVKLLIVGTGTVTVKVAGAEVLLPLTAELATRTG